MVYNTYVYDEEMMGEHPTIGKIIVTKNKYWIRDIYFILGIIYYYIAFPCSRQEIASVLLSEMNTKTK